MEILLSFHELLDLAYLHITTTNSQPFDVSLLFTIVVLFFLSLSSHSHNLVFIHCIPYDHLSVRPTALTEVMYVLKLSM